MAAETCIGRSEFTEIVAIVAESALDDSDNKTTTENFAGELKGNDFRYWLIDFILYYILITVFCKCVAELQRQFSGNNYHQHLNPYKYFKYLFNYLSKLLHRI